MGGIAGQPQGLPFGVQERKPSESERAFFSRTGIPGYAADDGRVVMSPSDLKGINKEAVRKNEAARIFLRSNPDFLDFELTKAQKEYLDTTAYKGKSETDRKATILARLFSGDPSAGKPNAKQSAALDRLVKRSK